MNDREGFPNVAREDAKKYLLPFNEGYRRPTPIRALAEVQKLY